MAGEWRIPHTLPSWQEHVRRTSTLSNEVFDRLDTNRINVYASASDVPSAPEAGDIAVVTYGPASGNGLYFYDGTNWNLVTSVIATLP